MQGIEIDFFRPEDAPGVARLFRRVYGEGYPVDVYYRPERLCEENAAGRVLSSVARTTAGEVVGHDALVLLDPASRLYENAAGAVLAECRGQGVFFRVFQHSIVDAAERFGAEEVIGEPVCNHLHLQKMCSRLGYVETGLEVDLMPAAAYTAEQSARGRVSVLLGYFRHTPAARTLYLPPVYRDPLEYLYAGMGVERSFAEPAGELPNSGATEGAMQLFPTAQVARIAIQRIGADFAPFAAELVHEAAGQGAEVFQLWLPLASPFAAAAADILRRRGFFLGGALPGWHGGDGLLMQKLLGETDWAAIALHSDRAERIAEIVRSDQQAVRR